MHPPVESVVLVKPAQFVDPAGLLQGYRFIADSRVEAIRGRLVNLEDPLAATNRLLRHHC